MDEMNKNTEPGITDQKQSENDAKGQDDVKIWQKPQTGKKKRYVYEVVTEESGENSTVQLLDGYFQESRHSSGAKSENESGQAGESGLIDESGQSDGFIQESERGIGAGEGADSALNEGSGQEKTDAKGEQIPSGNGSRNKTEPSATRKTGRRFASVKRHERRKKTEKESTAGRKEKKENLLEKDNISKKARQEFC